MIRRWFEAISVLALVSLTSCHQALQKSVPVRVPQGAAVKDRTFHSTALGRDVTYRVIAPAALPPGQTIRVVYLLHGNGSGFEEWSRLSSIAQLATHGWLLVMPEGGSSYFMNSATRPQDRYEDFLTRDLIADAEKGLVVERRAIVGVSMGGFAAIVLGFKHPELYGFVGALSPPVDAPERGFVLRRWGQWWGFRSIFGPMGSATRRAADPFLLAAAADPKRAPYVFLGVGRDEPLLSVVSRFDETLSHRGIAHQFQVLPGGHNWGQWDPQLPALIAALEGVRRVGSPLYLPDISGRYSGAHRRPSEIPHLIVFKLLIDPPCDSATL